MKLINFKFYLFRNHSTYKNSKKMVSCTEFNRLPTNVVPVNYNLELQPDIKNFTFNGKVVIDLNVS